MRRNIVITGGAGFIGSHVVRLFVDKYPDYKIINVDKLTYAGNLANLRDIENRPNYRFVKMDICDFEAFYRLMQEERVDGIIHLAAESHVDRSIKDPFTFARTNVMGTLSLLQAAKLYWEQFGYVMPENAPASGDSENRNEGKCFQNSPDDGAGIP
ncbi:MAG: GDP-mannose 4,6-dehydratase, partial [Bacteroidales bacterium]|nr:GDP-mannose 4,6-dehydratase [Bacteroidales bacterium]